MTSRRGGGIGGLRSRSDVLCGSQARERVRKLFTIERLDQKAIHAGFETGVAIFHQRVGGQRKDRRLAAGAAGLASANAPGRLDAIELFGFDKKANKS